MKTTKRLLAVLLALVLLCVGVPLAVAEGVTVVDSGSDGNISWTIDSGGVLTINGTGAMNNYTFTFDNDNGVSRTSAPWGKYFKLIETVVMNNGVTSIGQCAFYRCTALRSVSISDSVTSIGAEAFFCCSALQSVSIGNCVKSIESWAFYKCYELKNVIIPSNVKSIYNFAFMYCSSLQSVTISDGVTDIYKQAFSYTALQSIIIPKSLTYIENDAFYYCANLEEINVVEDNPKYSSSNDGCLYNKNKTTLILYPMGNERTEYKIPTSVTSISSEAFIECKKLVSISFSKNLKNIGDSAFYVCRNLKDVYYCGSEADWAMISIERGNAPLENAKLHLNHFNPDSFVRENEQPATCTVASSYEAVTYCTICGEEMSRVTTYEGDPLGHTPQTYTTPSTCAENGFTITICTRCGETLSKEILPRLDHNWTSEVTQNPTCTAQGVKTYTCESCGETYTEPVDILAHEWDDGKMTKAPSCTEAGEMTYTCATGGETRTEPIDKLDHEIVLVAGKAASCTEPGLTDGWQCKNCKKWFAEQQEIPALDHDPQIGKVVEPTCTEPGYTPFICTRCGETVSKTDPTDALGHNMQPTYVWAKDDTTVTATMICTRCEAIGATETAKVKTEITVKPTCSTEGELTLIAAFNNKSFYGQVKTKTLPRDPNAHVFKVTVMPPTCLDDGYTTHACTLCRYGYSDEIVPALGHDYQHHDAKAPTCEAPGWDAYDTCSRCDYTTYSEFATVDHDDADNDGKCDMCGDQMRGGSHCKYCGKIHGGAFGWLTKLLHSILAVFKR